LFFMIRDKITARNQEWSSQVLKMVDVYKN
jgi:hypothetical protein